ncbi:peptidase S28 [Pelagophyceae sp. CCMP2097]|nr:peptidase S28 [Pelagophyceae sp. CCMP2097]
MAHPLAVVMIAALFGGSFALPVGRVFRRSPPSAPAQGGLFFTQILDHFDRADGETFQQRYFVNDTFFNGSGPVFLCVGGEGPALDASVLYRSVHCSDATELAPRAGALLLALEHRFYGASVPVSADRGAERLKYLSSQQAVSDIAVFVEQVNANRSLDEANKWVAFGGSYPGMVAGFARLKLPHLIHAAVSSSAPWQARVDMREYNDVVGRSLGLASVGGSAACRDVVVQGHEAIRQRLAAGDFLSLAETFDFCNVSALYDAQTRQSWAGYGVIGVPSQENDPASTSITKNIGLICAALLADGGLEDAVSRLARVSRLQRGGCVGADESDDDDAVPAGDDGSDALSWPWQTCTEFGFYQTCEVDSQCPFARGAIGVSDEIGMCATLFDISAAAVAANVAFTNAFYGGDAPRATRVLFPNGDVDPWSGLGVLDSPGVEEPVMLVSGASHHAWTHPADTISQPSVADAKKQIQDQVLLWLQLD